MKREKPSANWPAPPNTPATVPVAVSGWHTVEFPVAIRRRRSVSLDPSSALGWRLDETGRTSWADVSKGSSSPQERSSVRVTPQLTPVDCYLMHTCVLADDHTVVRQSLKRLLLRESDLTLVAESNNGLEVLELVQHLQPDLLITDLMMPGLNGLEVIRRVRLASPTTRIVAVSVNSDEPYVEGAFTCGAHAYVLKASCGRHLISAVRAVLGGGRYISPPLTGSQ